MQSNEFELLAHGSPHASAGRKELKGSKHNLITLLRQVPDLFSYIPVTTRSHLGKDIFTRLESVCRREACFVKVGAAVLFNEMRVPLLPKVDA